MRHTLATAEATRELGIRLGRLLRAGDLLVLTGDLGAGKTTLTQGIANGLGVRGPITSPTFVIARVHPGLTGGPALVHVDAYRLGGLAELEDLDLEESLEDSVTVVEWGHGMAESLSDSHLEIVLEANPETEERTLVMRPTGDRWDSLTTDLDKDDAEERPC
ncbi:MAG: tRNA (adenosine(37)-N6)-threonylcarbamoyltransferase complex ATPase subunit type 1 TsaE [Micrococcales bacterium]|nr:tRNA (adenosine(37)-N6)-threonylcarbamoyltransferase complex ATPase subunit type 1 TsaE [Micrococcales bacterium]